MPEHAEPGEQQIADWTRQIQERSERYRELARRLDEQTVSETSADRTVRVTVSARGLLTDLSLTDAAAARGMAALSAQIMTTVRKAQARIPGLVEHTMAETVGTGGETADRIMAEANRHFPPVTEDPGPTLWREMRIDDEEFGGN